MHTGTALPLRESGYGMTGNRQKKQKRDSDASLAMHMRNRG